MGFPLGKRTDERRQEKREVWRRFAVVSGGVRVVVVGAWRIEMEQARPACEARGGAVRWRSSIHDCERDEMSHIRCMSTPHAQDVECIRRWMSLLTVMVMVMAIDFDSSLKLELENEKSFDQSEAAISIFRLHAYQVSSRLPYHQIPQKQ